MEIDAGLWMLLVCVIGLITCGCIMTAPKMALQDLNTARQSTPQKH
jgi:hypothetical protein